MQFITMSDDYANSIWFRERYHGHIQFLGDTVGSVDVKAALYTKTGENPV